MEKIIKKFQTHPLSGEQLLSVCNNQANLVTNSELKTVEHIDDILDPYDCCIILYDRKGKPGHWSAILRVDDNTIEFFCPYGYKVDEVTNIIGGKPYLSQLLMNSGYKFYSNPYKFQKKSPNVSVCGRFCGFRCLLIDYPLKDFAKMLLKNKHYDADWWITCLTLFCEN